MKHKTAIKPLTWLVLVIIVAAAFIAIEGCSTYTPQHPPISDKDLCLRSAIKIADGYHLTAGRYFFHEEKASHSRYEQYPQAIGAGAVRKSNDGDVVRHIRVYWYPGDTHDLCLTTFTHGTYCAGVKHLMRCNNHD